MSMDGIRIAAVRSRKFTMENDDVFLRLQAAVETGSRDALEQVLKRVHQEAVELAPRRNPKYKANPETGLTRGKPPQMWAPGLLKNSIGYYIKGDQQIGGLNTYGGEYRVSNDISEYPREGMRFGAGKSAGTVQGFVGTFVCHKDYVNWTSSYSYTKKEYVKEETANGSGWMPKRSRITSYERPKEEVQHTIDIKEEEALFSYGVWVEFNYKPFLRPAFYSIVDSGEFETIFINVLRRDIKDGLVGAIPSNGRYVHSGSGKWSPTKYVK